MAAILLAEDEESTIVLISKSLALAGHTVTAAATGEDGVAAAQRLKPDLIIMDIGLPGMTGFDAIRALKAHADLKHIPILALTAATTSGDRDEAYDAGCAAYEAKPINLVRLRERVVELVHA